MYVPATSKEVLYVPVTGPITDLGGAGATCSVAVIPDTGAEPATGDYQAATWATVNGDVVAQYLLDATLKVPGEYVVWLRVALGIEDVRRFSGRLRIGDART
jgi:hypothetical protein